MVPPEVIRGLPDWRALVIRMNLNPVVVKFRPAWKRLGYRLGRRVPVYVPRQQDTRALEREPAPAELAPALTEADLARFFDQDAPQATRARSRSRCRPARIRAPSSAGSRHRERRIRPAQIVPVPRCGWPDRECKAPDSAHGSGGGERRTWTYHDVQCQVPNPQPGPHLDGLPRVQFHRRPRRRPRLRPARRGGLPGSCRSGGREPEIEAEP